MSTSFRRRSAGVSAQPRVANDVVNVANSIVQEDGSAMAASQDATDENTAISWALTAAQNLDLVSPMRPSHAQIPKPQINVKGTRSSGENGGNMIKAVPRRPVITAFVGTCVTSPSCCPQQRRNEGIPRV